MSDKQWAAVESDFESAKRHFLRAVELHERLQADASEEDREFLGMAFMHAMQIAHTSLESGLARMLAFLDEERPVGASWPADLIHRAAREIPGRRPAILDADAAELAHQTLRFRHLAMRRHDAFDPTKATDSVVAAKRLALTIGPPLSSFKAFATAHKR
jgi:hypothetical protein